MKFRMMALSAFALLAANVAAAGEPGSMQRGEETWVYSAAEGTAVPVPCLGPEVYMEGTEHTVWWFRDYYSPTGAHYVKGGWRSDFEFHDQYGNTWIGSAVASVKDVTLGLAESHMYVAHLLFKPVLGDEAMWQMRNVGMVRVNSDGKVIVDHPPFSTLEEVERCLPARKKK